MTQSTGEGDRSLKEDAEIAISWQRHCAIDKASERALASRKEEDVGKEAASEGAWDSRQPDAPTPVAVVVL